MSWDLKEPECLSQARLMVASPEFVYEQLRKSVGCTRFQLGSFVEGDWYRAILLVTADVKHHSIMGKRQCI